jgi:hypothetical protein
MTAPAESRMPLAFDSYLGLGSSYNSPASTAAFDPDFSWDPMPPHQESDGKLRSFHVEVRFGVLRGMRNPSLEHGRIL